VAVCDDDKVIGALISKDNIVHLAIVPEYRGKWASRRIIREMLKYGKTTNDSSKQDFVERIGFVKNGSMYELKETSWHS
jgi:GNAT superfamily N-acetyltransferase